MPNEFKPAAQSQIEQTTQALGRELFDQLRVSRPRPWQRQWWDEKLLSYAMHDDAVKVQMFRFIDVLPMLERPEAVTTHLQDYTNQIAGRLPFPARWSLNWASPHGWSGRMLTQLARRSARSNARRFIAGSNVEEAIAAARRERELGRGFTLDILGEAVISDHEADKFLQSYLYLIENISPQVNQWEEIPTIDRDHHGPIPRMNLSIKLSALDSHFDPIDPEGALKRVGPRLRTLLRKAKEHRAFINLDMESYATKDLTLWLFKQVLSEEEFRDVTDVGIVIQAYLWEAERDLIALRDWAEQRGAPVWVRLVKGAYWDYETILAQQEGWPIPVFQQKWQSDAQFERCAAFLLQNREHLRPALGSHNLRSLAYSLAVAKHLEIPEDSFEIQMLYGMADQEKEVFVQRGYRLRTYMPYGELIPGMAYLVRRLLENTSNNSFLRAGFTDHLPPEILLKNPAENETEAATTPFHTAPSSTNATLVREQMAMKSSPLQINQAFRNEPLTDFSQAKNREAMQAALAEVKQRFGQTYPLWIGGKAVHSDTNLVSVNPSNSEEVVGNINQGDCHLVEEAVTAARQATKLWRRTPVSERADYLRNAAKKMRERRFELAAWAVWECGKPWREADGDIAEAIDFLEYYSLQAENLFGERSKDVPGEENQFRAAPRGVVAVIAPWNFPLAILTGMTSAALVTGNTVIMKPAEQSPIIAWQLMQIFQEIGLPPGVLNLLPGDGETVGEALVIHPKVHMIAFTGSRQVGLTIHRQAAEVSASGQIPYVKEVIAEMGGKNAIIVDDDADLDEAIQGVVKSAFGYQGQKCSACSRLILLESIHDAFVERMIDAIRSLKVGPAEDPGTDIGPLIDRAAQLKVEEAIEEGEKEGESHLAFNLAGLSKSGFYVAPQVFTGIDREAMLAQKELFGPVLAVLKAKDLEEAIEIANDVEYALTGGFYSRSPAHVEQVCQEFMVGNLYINRPCTGALVSRQPFGGFKLSGMGTQAGGVDYLKQFVVARTITENTMRRGFAPEPEVTSPSESQLEETSAK
ncbi:L-glutamate gamma-semialdehyde dehydrogenase [Planctomycetales bacterium 10988]|nr:L-glutamate gamma-semialdehyde dehydrogenase [Planctomycetales bacterium 10988]